eukprot:gene16441-5023_t
MFKATSHFKVHPWGTEFLPSLKDHVVRLQRSRC